MFSLLTVSLCCSKVFPGFTVYGCKFHWKSVVREHLKPGGLLVFESDNEDFAEVVQWLLVLVYIRPAEVRHYFSAVVAYVEQKILGQRDAEWVRYGNQLGMFFNYFLNTWVGTDELPAKYDSDHWSCSRSLVDPSILTTSNGTEAYNYHITKAIGASANRFWRTVQAIQDEESYARYTTTTTTMSLLCRPSGRS